MEKKMETDYNGLYRDCIGLYRVIYGFRAA